MATEPTESTEEIMLLEEDLTYQVRGAVYEVYEQLGHGYLEKVYERAPVAELGQRGLRARPQVPFVVRYKETAVGEYYVDVLIEDKIVVELKAQSRLGPADETQLLNYLKASGLRVGMLVNFAHPKARIKRLVS